MATNIKLFKYKGRPANKFLCTLLLDEHKIIINALQKKEDADGTMDWKIKVRLNSELFELNVIML